MAARCVNGHDTPRGQACMYCGAPLAVSVVPPPPVTAYGAPPPRPLPPPPGPLSALALISFIISFLFPPGSLPALIMALIALSRIDKRNQSGKGFAVAGAVIGGIGTAIIVVSAFVIFVLAGTSSDGEFPGVVRKDAAACETEARTLLTASEAYFAQGDHPTPYPRTAKELVESGMLRREPELLTIRGDGQTQPDLIRLDGNCEGVDLPGD